MLYNTRNLIKSIDAQLARVKVKAWYDEDEVTPDELLDKRLALMKREGWKPPTEKETPRAVTPTPA